MLYYLLIFFALNLSTPLSATSLVYNIKIRRIFSGLQQFLGTEQSSYWQGSIVPTWYRGNAFLRSVQTYEEALLAHKGNGVVLNIRYTSSPTWWCEATTAHHKESLYTFGESSYPARRQGLDDIVVTAGGNLFPSPDTQVTGYGLVGFPTQWHVTSLDKYGPLVGGRFFAAGVGAELSHRFMHYDQRALSGAFQLRLVHFFERSWEPILPHGGKIRPGEILDLLFSLRYRTGAHLLEGGYNSTFFFNQAQMIPHHIQEVPSHKKHSWYFNYQQAMCPKFLSRTILLGVGVLSSGVYAQHEMAAQTTWWFLFTLLF